jgi:hypothetical protein
VMTKACPGGAPGAAMGRTGGATSGGALATEGRAARDAAVLGSAPAAE